MNLRYVSQAKIGSPESVARLSATAGVIPTFRTVSIMPGIENFAPDLTDTKSGFFGFPNSFPVIFSSSVSDASTWS